MLLKNNSAGIASEGVEGTGWPDSHKNRRVLFMMHVGCANSYHFFS